MVRLHFGLSKVEWFTCIFVSSLLLCVCVYIDSWGWSWGVDGYFLIERGVNMCRLSSCASFPIVAPDMML